ncbi:MAG: efflux RND transporter permease subunit, partial [Planctomycetales bacterium]|nr:efflux RND transporter permease subunit [Planctomycetales bacterium]
MSMRHTPDDGHTDVLSGIVRIFLNSNLSMILIVFSVIVGAAALFITPREEDPQIVVPLADLYVQFPGHTADEVEQLVSTPLERMLYQIDGVEYVYSMSRDDQAIITVRFYVGQDRERSLVKLFKKLNENNDSITPGVTGWVMKPVEIDDVPIVTLALTGAGDDSYQLRRMAEELVERLSIVPQVSRAAVIGGQSRT